MVVHHEELAHPGVGQPVRNRRRAHTVVRHQADERWSTELRVGGQRRHLQDTRRAENWSRFHDLAGVEVPEVCDCLGILRGLPGGVGCTSLSVLAGCVERKQLHGVVIRSLERQLGTAEQLPAERARRAGQWQAGVHVHA